MIQSICSVCGNRKTFDVVYLGRLFKCPNCKSPVKVEHSELDDSSFEHNVNKAIDGSSEDVDTAIKSEILKNDNNKIVNESEKLAEKAVENIALAVSQNNEQTQKNREGTNGNRVKTQILVTATIIISIIIFWRIYTSTDRYNLDGIPASDTVSYNQVDTTTIINSDKPIDKLGEIYTTILSVTAIQQHQIDNLSLSDLIEYKNEMLARHSYEFDQPFFLEIYKKKEWYRSYNNYLVATSNFSEIEKYNFTLLENELQTNYNKLSDKIKAFYSSIYDQTFDASNYFSENVERFITKSNLDPQSINQEMASHYEEFKESKYEFSDPLEITLVKSENGINYFNFKFFFSAYRVSKNKQETCEVTVELGFDKDQKMVSYKEVKIENLKFSDPIIDVSSTEQ